MIGLVLIVRQSIENPSTRHDPTSFLWGGKVRNPENEVGNNFFSRESDAISLFAFHGIPTLITAGCSDKLDFLCNVIKDGKQLPT